MTDSLRNVLAASGALAASLAGCSPTKPNELDKLGSVDMTIKGQAFRMWIADEFDEQMKGLMFITTEQMQPISADLERGMIFVFDRDQTTSFWMKNTIIPLDIAYVTADGRVVKTYTMAPLDDRSNAYPPGEPYRYAIEVNADRFVALGLTPGNMIEIPNLP